MAAAPTGIIYATSTSALDCISSRVRLVDRRHSAKGEKDVFFLVLKVDEIEALAPWTDAFATFVEESYTAACRTPGATVEQALSTTRQRASQKLRQLIRDTKTVRVDDVHYCFGVIDGLTITLTNSGDVSAYVLHGRTSTEGSRRYRWIDVTGAGKTKGQRRSPVANQPSLLAGEVTAGDLLLVATESVIDTLGLARLQRLMTDTSIDASRAVIERSLKAAAGRTSYGAVLLGAGAPAHDPKPAETVTSSMASLLSRQSVTAHLLAASARSPLQSLRNTFHRPTVHTERPAPAEEARRPVRVQHNTAESIGRAVGRITNLTIASILALTRRLLMLGHGTALLAKSPGGGARLTAASRRFLDTTVERIRALPRSSQRLLIIAMLFAYLFVQTLVFLADRQGREALIEANGQTIAAIQDRLDRAESSVIFGNDGEAARLLSEAETLFGEFVVTNRRQEEQRSALQGAIDGTRQQLERLVVVTGAAAETVATLSGSGLPDADRLAVDDRAVMLIRQSSPALAVVSDGTATPFPLSIDGLTAIRAVKQGSDGDIYLWANAGLVRINAQAKSSTLQPIANLAPTTLDVALYNGRLFALAPEQKQVMRLQLRNGTFDQPAPWVKGDAADIARGSALAVDGSVYVLTDRAILKFFSGSLQEWSAFMPPSAQSLERLATTERSDYLSALDHANGRVLVWKKENGQLVRQFAFPDIGGVQDYAIDTEDAFLYVLGTDRVVRTPLPPAAE